MDYIVPSRFDPEVSSHSIRTLSAGLTASDVRRVLHTDISRYVALSRDRNPIHSNPEYAQGTRFGQEIALGLLPEGILSSLLGTKLPGQGTIYVGKTVSFRAPVNAGDQLTTVVRIEKVDSDRRLIDMSGDCANQDQKVIAKFSMMLMLDTGQEQEFLSDFFKFATEKDPCDQDFRRRFTEHHALTGHEKLQHCAGVFDWGRCPELASHMSMGLFGEGVDEETRRRVLALYDAALPTAQLQDTIIWWSVGPSLFTKLTEEYEEQPEAAIAKMVAWAQSIDCVREQIALAGLERLNEVELGSNIACFNPISSNEVTGDLIRHLGSYVAGNLM